MLRVLPRPEDGNVPSTELVDILITETAPSEIAVFEVLRYVDAAAYFTPLYVKNLISVP